MNVLSPCLYDVSISHSRRVPTVNSFRYRSYMWLVDLDELPRLPRVVRGLAGFRPVDHLDIRDELRQRGIDAPRVLMLTTPRILGYVFNPLSVYWCYGNGGELLANVAEVHNTYGGRHAYVFTADENGRAQMNKEMYVSPFYPVDGTYDIQISEPDEAVKVSIALRRGASETFGAALSGARRPATLANLLRAAVRYPWAPLRVRVLIQWQGIRLWRKGLEVQPR